MQSKTNYGSAIREGFEHVLKTNSKSLVMGQGLWSPWYVGNSMKDLDKQFGKQRVIDTPVSELATTGAGIGAALNGYSVCVVHPRMDFMILAADQIVNQAAKWRHMLGGVASPNVTFRSIINRGGEQGAQHSQALHSWYAHIPRLRILMPGTVADARDMLIAAFECKDPVLYIDDRWCYELEDYLDPIRSMDIEEFKPTVRREGSDITIAAASYSYSLALSAADILSEHEVSAEVIDVRQLNPSYPQTIIESVNKTGRFVAIDGGWSNCGFGAELIASVVEKVEPHKLLCRPRRFTLPNSPAPCSKALEKEYYTSAKTVADKILSMVTNND